VETSLLFVLEFNNTISERVKGVVATRFDVLASMVLSAFLANYNLTFFDGLCAEYFNA